MNKGYEHLAHVTTFTPVIRGAEVIQCIVVHFGRGDGEETPYRDVAEYWTFEGEYMGEIDPLNRPTDRSRGLAEQAHQQAHASKE